MAIIQSGEAADPDYYDNWEATGGGIYLKPGGGGYAYEDGLFSKLKSLGLTPKNFAPAGTSNTLPDLQIETCGVGAKTFNRSVQGANKIANIELKQNAAADYGQSGLKWDSARRWYLSGKNTPEAQEMRRLLTSLGVVQKVNSAWGEHGGPKKFTAAVTGSGMLPADYQSDREKFRDVYMTGSDAPSVNTLFRYYAAKPGNGCHYLQIGGYGLYYMASDPLQLKKIGVKRFDGTMKLRIRRKAGGSRTEPWNYRFSTALQVDGSPTTSGFNLEQSPEDLLKFLDPFGVVQAMNK